MKFLVVNEVGSVLLYYNAAEDSQKSLKVKGD